ncbi:MAG: HAD hydrolase family protein [Ignavibacteriae bacterium]|jgi:3-deoxy-D-manno-octulosonate 8-phosphate phosphatase (KDO 8-P phosphatase)|nr:hypothetical protein [Ignavibacteriota bacterium]NOG97027.1 HAD hydrolase family protein [Ignavibacteriota bacterium]
MTDNTLKFNRIKFLLFDIDGVLVNRYAANPIGDLACYKDVLIEALNYFRVSGYKSGIVTARGKDNVTEFLSELPFDEFYTSSIDKVSPIELMLHYNDMSFEELMYTGDDILDIPLMQKSGFSICPADAKREVRRIADMILENNGGIQTLAEIVNFIENSKSRLTDNNIK